MIREVAAKLGVEVDGKAAVDLLNGSLDKAKGLLGKIAAGLAVGAAAKFVKDQLDAADALGDTAAQLGLTTDELQRWQYAVKLSGGEVEGAGKSLFLLNKQLGEAAKTGGGPFAEMGIELKGANGQAKTALEILPDVADKIAEAGSHSEQTAMATKLFGKQALALLPLLKKGREGLKELAQEYDDLGLGLSKDFVEAAGQANDQMDRLDFASKALKSQLIAALVPSITKVVGWLIKLVAWGTKLARETRIVQVVLAALTAVLAYRFLPMLWTAIQGVMTATKTFLALRTAVFGASVPVWLIVAAIVALVLIFEDLYTMINGGDSLIGRLLDKFGGIGTKQKVIEKFKAVWRDIVIAWNDAKTSLAELWKTMGPEVIDGLTTAFSFLVKGIAASVKGLAGLGSIVKKVIDGDYAGALAEANKTSDAIFGASRSVKTIGPDGKVNEVKENVGGLFGITDKEYQAKLVTQGLAKADPAAAAQVKNQLQVTVVAPGADPSKVEVKATANADAFHGVVTGAPKS